MKLTLSCSTVLPIACFIVSVFQSTAFSAAYPPLHHDESRVQPYVLPDPLVMNDGTKVESAQQWKEKRRPEILAMFEETLYGKVPEKARNVKLTGKILSREENVLDGKATRLFFRLYFDPNTKMTAPVANTPAPFVDWMIYVPNKRQGKVPAFLSFNFRGNATTTSDPTVPLGTTWFDEKGRKATTPRPDEDKNRAFQERRWPYAAILDRGYAVITAHYEEVYPDYKGGFKSSVQPYFFESGQTTAKPDEWGAITTWAWGMSRMLDQVENHSEEFGIDPQKVIALGHSRLGKTALWVGACDERFAIAIANDSGCAGASLYRRVFGETIWRMNTVYPNWMNENCKQYQEDVNTLPVDSHELIALIAPRPVYVASASKDLHADPQGEFLAAFHADPVYRLLGTDGIGDVKEMPPVNTPVGGTIGYHRREGVHDILEYDWIQFMNFADRFLNP